MEDLTTLYENLTRPMYHFGELFLTCPSLFNKFCELKSHTSRIIYNFWKVMKIYKIDEEIIESFIINERKLLNGNILIYDLDSPAGKLNMYMDREQYRILEKWTETPWFRMYNFFEKARKALFRDLYSMFNGPF